MATRKRISRGGRRKPPQRGGEREGAGRRTMFPGKYAPGGMALGKLGVSLTPLAKQLLEELADQLHDMEPVGPKTLSDATEFCIRTATRTPMDAST